MSMICTVSFKIDSGHTPHRFPQNICLECADPGTCTFELRSSQGFGQIYWRIVVWNRSIDHSISANNVAASTNCVCDAYISGVSPDHALIILELFDSRPAL